MVKNVRAVNCRRYYYIFFFFLCLDERRPTVQIRRRVLGALLGGGQKQFRDGRNGSEKTPGTRIATVETCHTGRQQSRHGQEQRSVGPR